MIKALGLDKIDGVRKIVPNENIAR